METENKLTIRNCMFSSIYLFYTRHMLPFIAYSLCISSLTACGSEPIEEYPKELEGLVNEFKGYCKQYNKECFKEGVTIKVEYHYKWLRSEIIGHCEYKEYHTPFIRLKGEWWEMGDSLDKESLLFHEFGHCILNRGHNDITSSLMASYLIDKNRYKKKKVYYINELFTGGLHDK